MEKNRTSKPVLNLEIRLKMPDCTGKELGIIENYGGRFARDYLEGEKHVTEDGIIHDGYSQDRIRKAIAVVDLGKMTPNLNFLEKAVQASFKDSILDYYEVKMESRSGKVYHIRTMDSKMYIPEIGRPQEKKVKNGFWERMLIKP